MSKDKIIRGTLFTTTVFNFVVALMLAFPITIGKLAQLPEPASFFYTSLMSMLVALFGGAYAWLALQKQINRPLLTFATIGKTGVFIVSLYYWLAGQITFFVFTVAIADLIFASIFVWWLVSKTTLIKLYKPKI